MERPFVMLPDMSRPCRRPHFLFRPKKTAFPVIVIFSDAIFSYERQIAHAYNWPHLYIVFQYIDASVSSVAYETYVS